MPTLPSSRTMNNMVDIKYTNFISNLYPIGKICKNGNPIKIIYFDKKYFVSFMNRNDKDVEHLIITNYKNQYD